MLRDALLAGQFPPNLIVIASSRREPAVLEEFDFVQPIELDVHCDEARLDVADYVRQRLQQDKLLAGLCSVVQQLSAAAQSETTVAYLETKSDLKLGLSGAV